MKEWRREGVPGLEGTGINLHNGALNQGLGANLMEDIKTQRTHCGQQRGKTHQLVVGGVVANLQDTGALGSALA